MFKHAFIDAKNLLYRCLYANSDQEHEMVDKSIHMFINTLLDYKRHADANHIHIFWDEERNKVWRRYLYPGYKNRDDSEYVNGFRSNLQRCIDVLKQILIHLPVRQYWSERQEADDLIYAAAIVLEPDPIVVFSTDGDMTQIPFKYKHVRVYHHKKGMLDKPSISPVLIKCLMGDSSDSIDGYKGIGPVKAEKMIIENRIDEFLAKAGKTQYEFNVKLIDLSLNPDVVRNKIYVASMLAAPVSTNITKFNTALVAHKLGTVYQNSALIKREFLNLPPQLF
jgi:5'-3' exonuclease